MHLMGNRRLTVLGSIAAISLFFLTSASAQERERSADFHVDFPWDNSTLNLSYMKTGDNLRALADSIASIGSDRIDSISICSYSSPEGKLRYNKKLSERRAAAMRRYMDGQFPQLSGKTRITPDAESWNMFRDRVLADSSLTEAQRADLLTILDSSAAPDEKKRLIQKYDRALWNRIVREWFVDMRRSFIRLHWTEEGRAQADRIPAVETAEAMRRTATFTDDSGIDIDLHDIYIWKTIFALKTNLLYDAVTALNVEAEIPIGDKFSVAVEDVFPWWTWGPNDKKYCFQMWEIGIEPRWWFAPTARRDKLSGHFVGAYAMSSKYDFQRDTKYCYQGEYWSAGLTYGYSLPLGKWLNMEFSLSAGFLQSDYRHYQPDTAYEHLYRDPYKVGKVSWFGPTKAKVSLVMPILIRKRLQ
jgi:hypothetical protein